MGAPFRLVRLARSAAFALAALIEVTGAASAQPQPNTFANLYGSIGSGIAGGGRLSLLKGSSREFVGKKSVL